MRFWIALGVVLAVLGAYNLLLLRPFDAMFYLVLAAILGYNVRKRR